MNIALCIPLNFCLLRHVRNYKIRIISGLISLAIVYIAIKQSSQVLAQTESTYRDFVSYWGTVATLVALVLAIAEILHSIQATKSLQEEVSSAIFEMHKIEDASAISDCIAAIDVISQAVLNERYDAAVGGFQHFRKLCVRIIPSFRVSEDANAPAAYRLNQLSQIELKLLAATRSTMAAPFSKPQKHDVLKKLQLIKQSLEQYNPANRSQNASSKNS